MRDVYLKFPDQQTAEALLFVTEENGERILRYAATDFIRELTPGCHVNLRLMDWEDLTAELTAYEIGEPEFPKRVWA